jgi:hypothetical protein
LTLWHLLSWVAYAEAALTRGYDTRTVQQAIFTTRRTGTPSLGFDSLGNFLSALATNSIILVLPSVAVGMIFSLARYATGAQRHLLCLLLIGIACLCGTWMGWTGYSAATSDPTLQRIVLSGSGMAEPQWQWQLVGGVSGALIAFVATRLGLAIGLRFISALVGMFISPQLTPKWLARKPR